MKTRFFQLFAKIGSAFEKPRAFYAAAMIVLGAVMAGLLVWWLFIREDTKTLDFYSGQPDGIYNPLAEEIKKQIELHTDIVVKVKTSPGSLENSKAVSEDQNGSGLAIVQNEVPP